MESELKHTPGPWTTSGPAQFSSTPNCMVYASHENGHLVASCDPGNSPNQAANANLIAASPELLEACIAARAKLGMSHAEHPVWRMLDEAIKKATGGTDG